MLTLSALQAGREIQVATRLTNKGKTQHFFILIVPTARHFRVIIVDLVIQNVKIMQIRLFSFGKCNIPLFTSPRNQGRKENREKESCIGDTLII